MPNDAFPASPELATRTTRLLARTETLRHSGFEPELLAEEVIVRQDQLSSRLAPQLQALASAQKAVRRNGVAAVQVVAYLLVGIAFVGLGFNVSDIRYLNQLDTWVIVLSVVLIDLSLLALAIAAAAGMIQRNFAADDAKHSFDRALDTEIPPLLRTIINDWEENRAFGNDFDAVDGPALVELATEATISSESFTQVREFIASHDSSAIGIAGNRGVGKSTVMDRLERDNALGCIPVRVQAPVLYDAPGLIRLIHVRLAEAAMAQRTTREQQTRLPLELIKSVGKSLGAALLALMLLVLVFAEQQAVWSSTDWKVGPSSVIAIAVAGALLAYAGHRLLPSVRREALLQSTATDAATLGRQQLELLRHTTELQSTRGGRLAVGRSFVNLQQQVKLTENTLSHAENVARLRRFFEQLGAASDRILICVDELDKMSKPDDVIATINSIKDLMHVPRVHFVVSVSTDAMHQFAMRGVPLRDVFDSTFDAVITVKRLRFGEARQVLRRRTINFPVPTMMFCHVWSGGVARDLIRTARACVDQRKAAGGPIPIEALVATILRDDLLEVVNAAVAKLRTAEATKQSAQLARVYYRLRSGSRPLREEIEQTLDKVVDVALGEADGEAGAVAHALPQLMQLTVLILRLFDRGRTPDEWKDAALLDQVEQLAEIRSALNVHPDAAAALLKEITGGSGLLGSIRRRLAR